MTIAEFLVKIASEPKLLEQFNDEKRQGDLLRDYDLTEEQREFLRSNDLRILRVKVESELTVAGESLVFSTICRPPPPPPGEDCPPE